MARKIHYYGNLPHGACHLACPTRPSVASAERLMLATDKRDVTCLVCRKALGMVGPKQRQLFPKERKKL